MFVRSGCIALMLLVFLSACSGGSGDAIDLESGRAVQSVSVESRGDFEYKTIRSQTDLSALNYEQILPEDFIIDYFDLSTQGVSSTQFMISDPHNFDIPSGAVSFGFNFYNELAGSDLFMVQLINPLGDIIKLQDSVPCFFGFCGAVIPNRPDELFNPEEGQWTFRVIVERNAYLAGELGQTSLNFYIRTGEEHPVVSNQFEATLRVQPFYTGSRVAEWYVNDVMNEFVNVFRSNNIAIEFKPVIHIPQEHFDVVDPSYNSEKTKQLMSYGRAGEINLYLIESFDDFGADSADHFSHPKMPDEVNAIGGIAPGIPGSMGTEGAGNGVMAAMGFLNGESYFPRSAREIAETAAHEVGHFLGLYHTTEFSGHVDFLEDTPECAVDEDSGQIPVASECPDGYNLMFPSSRDDGEPGIILTDDQRFVIINSPMAY